MEGRKFYKTVITVTVLSEDGPISMETDLDVVAHQIIHGDWIHGDWSGKIENDGGTELTPKEMADEALKQGSDPGFFGLDEDGNEVER
jgi:hypothetical protein